MPQLCRQLLLFKQLLTAAPASGWHVASWTNANQDGNSMTNTVTIFGVNQTVTVNYAVDEAMPQLDDRIFLPNARK